MFEANFKSFGDKTDHSMGKQRLKALRVVL
jgi:hypothetical protein